MPSLSNVTLETVGGSSTTLPVASKEASLPVCVPYARASRAVSEGMCVGVGARAMRSGKTTGPSIRSACERAALRTLKRDMNHTQLGTSGSTAIPKTFSSLSGKASSKPKLFVCQLARR